mmetsp:Transcript_46777/g.141957  ORF Transcript_46777/g.141957 Transcript_46777/m.141957 type:complete len:427 (+) Transcript_46777:257-1537(+)
MHKPYWKRSCFRSCNPKLSPCLRFNTTSKLLGLSFAKSARPTSPTCSTSIRSSAWSTAGASPMQSPTSRTQWSSCRRRSCRPWASHASFHRVRSVSPKSPAQTRTYASSTTHGFKPLPNFPGAPRGFIDRCSAAPLALAMLCIDNKAFWKLVNVCDADRGPSSPTTEPVRLGVLAAGATKAAMASWGLPASACPKAPRHIAGDLSKSRRAVLEGSSESQRSPAVGSRHTAKNSTQSILPFWLTSRASALASNLPKNSADSGAPAAPISRCRPNASSWKVSLPSWSASRAKKRSRQGICDLETSPSEATRAQPTRARRCAGASAQYSHNADKKRGACRASPRGSARPAAVMGRSRLASHWWRSACVHVRRLASSTTSKRCTRLCAAGDASTHLDRTVLNEPDRIRAIVSSGVGDAVVWNGFAPVTIT